MPQGKETKQRRKKHKKSCQARKLGHTVIRHYSFFFFSGINLKTFSELLS